MILFHWNGLSTCENHATGDGVVMARDVEEARATLRASLEAWAAENREYVWLHGDEEDRAEIQAKIDADDVASTMGSDATSAAGVIVRGSE
jgi:hypothetical protein